MGNTDKTLQDKDYLNIYPITRERNVYDENNVNLKTKFETVVFKDNNVHKFAQELYEESKNEFNINSKEIVWGEYWVDGTNKGRYANSFYSIQEIKPNTTYAISFKNEINPSRYAYNILDANKNPLSWKYESLEKTYKEWVFTTESNARYIVISQLDTSKENVGNLFIQLEKGNVVTSHEKYNPNQQITNPQAEFLKDEHDKRLNLFPPNNLEVGTFGSSQGNETYQGSRVRTIEPIILEKGFYTISNKDKQIVVYVFDETGAFIKNESFTTWSTSNTFTFEILSPRQVRFAFRDKTEIDLSPSDVQEVMLNKGNVLRYYPYNSSSHITNPQADLLKSEYDKQINLLPLPIINETLNGVTVTCDGYKLSVKGTATSQYLHYFDLLTPIQLNGNYKFYYFNGNYTGDNNIALRTNENTNIMDSPPNIANRINSLNNITATVTQIGVYVPNGETVNVEMYPLLVESNVSVDSPYRYNGKIIHEKNVLNLKYLHTINLLTDNWRLWLNIYCDMSQSFTAVELSKWLHENGYTSNTLTGPMYQISGADRSYGRFACAISSPNNGSNVLYLTYGVESGAEGANITISSISDHVVEIIGGN